MTPSRYAELRHLVEERGDCVKPSMLGECLDALVAAERIAVALAGLAQGRAELCDAYRTGRTPHEATWKLLDRGRVALPGDWEEQVAAMRERQR